MMSSTTSTLDVDALGHTVRLALPPEIDARVSSAISAAWADAAPTSSRVPARVIDLRESDFADIDRGLSNLSVRVTLEALDHVRGSLILLHACGVATDDGDVLAFVGPSGRGKTTAARVLSESLGYVTDETVAVGANGEVFPYRKPLSVIQPGSDVKAQLAGQRPLPDAPLRLASLVLLDRRGDAPDEPVIRRVPLVDAISELVPQLSYFSELPDPLWRLSTLIDSVGGVRRVTYREAHHLPAIVDRLRARAPVAVTWSTLSSESAHDGPGYAPTAGSAVIETDGKLCVLANAQLLVLDGIAPTIWAVTRDSGDVDVITRAVIDAHGTPPEGDTRALVLAALEELRSAGALERR